MNQTKFNKTVLKNGLTIVSEQVKAFRSIALGVWVKSGSRFEKHEEMGMAHFIEHMLFKGTASRSAFEIASSLEDLGGNINAFTGKEETCFYVHSLDTHLEISVQVLADMICNSLFDPADIAMEKQVVLEEINSVKDTPDEYIFDVFQEKVFPDQALGYPILGMPENIKSFNKDNLVEFWKKYYHPANIVIAAAGNVDHSSLVDLIKLNFNFTESADIVEMPKAQLASNVNITLNEPVNQTHICVGSGSASYYDADRFDLIALNTYLGGGLSSRLFQTLREELGLVYTIYSFLDFYKDTGIFGFYLGTDFKNQKKAFDELKNELYKTTTEILSEEKVDKLKEQIKGSFFLAMESTFKRMSRLAKNEIYFNRFVSADTLSETIDKISPDSIFTAARKHLIIEKLNSVILSSGKINA